MAACFVTLTAVAAHATVLVSASLGELTRDARAIVRGRVVAVDAQWTQDRRTIETIVTLATEQYIKGQLGETLQFRVPGGLLGRYRSVVVGAPRFAPGQRVIVFLGTQGPMVPYVLGLSQGVFRVGQTERGDLVVTPPAPMTSAPVERGSPVLKATALVDFERDVRALLDGRP